MIRSHFTKQFCIIIFIIFFFFLDFTYADNTELQVEENLYYQCEIKADYSQEADKMLEPQPKKLFECYFDF